LKRRIRLLAWLLAGLFAGLLALGASGFWLATTPDGLRRLTGTVAALSQDRVSFEAVEGSLDGVLSIGKLTLLGDTRRIEIEQLRLQWQPRALWQRRIEIDLLAVRALRIIETKPDTTPPTLPDSLRAPLDLHVHALDLARLDIVRPGQHLTFRHLRAGLDARGDHYRLSGISAVAPWGEARGLFELGKDAPFPLRGRIATGSREPYPVTAVLHVGGSLAAPTFSLDARAEGMQLMARGELAPFAQVRLTRLLLAGQGINPRRFAAAVPNADLAFSGVFEGKLQADRAGDRLLGTFSLSNRLAGRFEQQRLPLANLTGAVLGDSAHADFSALLIDLGSAGRLTGSGQWRTGRVSLDLAGAGLDLAGLHADFNPTRIKTSLRLNADANRQQLDGEVSETWGRGQFRLAHAAGALRLESASFKGQAGRLTAKGEMRLDAGRAFGFEFDAAAINPARFGRFPLARLNARGRVSGVLLPELRLQADFTLPPGELEGRPVRGRARLGYANGHLFDADIDLDLAGNRARIMGAYGHVGDRFAWDIAAPALVRLQLGLAGHLSSSGSAGGDPKQPQIDAQLAAGGLRLPGGIAAETLNLKLNLRAAANGAFNGRLDARGVVLAGQHLQQLSASAEGRRDAHTLTLSVRQDNWRLNADLRGGMDSQPTWRGELTQAQLHGEWPMRLTAPAVLHLSRARQRIENLALSLAGGRIDIEQFDSTEGRIETRGAFGNLPVQPILAHFSQALPFSTDLRLDGNWNLRLGDTLDGHAHLRRRSGDLRLHQPAHALGLSSLALDFEAIANRVSARIEAVGSEAGKLRANGQATLLRHDAGFTLPRSAPLVWQARIEMADLRPLQSYIPPGLRADARLEASLNGGGSLAAPQIEGRIDADAIRFAMPEQGIVIHDGMLKLDLADDRLRVREGVLNGSAGRVVLSGEAQLKNLQAGLTLRFERFAASNRGDRRILVSGLTRLNLDRNRLHLGGELRADRARLETPEASRPELGADVIVSGRPAREKSAVQRLPLALDLKLDLGSDFMFKGGGIDARLGGQLRVFTVNDMLHGEGGIRVESGRYAAYGQSLDIERGILRFGGMLDNPGLDVLAVRKTATVKAGVLVRGTLRRPQVTLYSDPALPDTEKLSWLVLGHGLETGGQQEFALLRIAAGALFNKGDAVNFESQLAEALRIDSFDLRAGGGADLASTVVSVGKRLSARATLSYEQSLDGLSQVVKVLYQLSPRVRLEAQAGQQSSIDAFYSVEYDD
jgi:translocation and assembly module TamB